MFSRRLSSDLRINRLTAALERGRRNDERIVDLTLSNPTRAGFVYPDRIRRALAEADGTVYRPEPFGLLDARRAVADYYAERGVQVPVENILLTASTSEAYAFLFKLLADPGDELLVPRPSYPLFDFLAELEGLAARSYPLRYADGWEIDLDRLAAAIGERSRAILLVSPNNPTGSYLKRSERKALEELAAECDLALIVDEVFADYPLEDSAERTASCAADSGVLTFTLSGLSKVLGLPQLKLSWLVVDGPDPARRQALERLEMIADSYLSVGTPVQEALPELLLSRREIQEQIRARTRTNLDLLRSLDHPGIRLLRCEGGWYAIIAGERDEEELALELLEEEGVLAHPGYFFDLTRGNHLVLSLIVTEFAEGIEKLIHHLDG